MSGWILADTGTRGLYRYEAANPDRHTVVDGYYLIPPGGRPNPGPAVLTPLGSEPAGWASLCAVLWHVNTGVRNTHMPALVGALLSKIGGDNE